MAWAAGAAFLFLFLDIARSESPILFLPPAGAVGVNLMLETVLRADMTQETADENQQTFTVHEMTRQRQAPKSYIVRASEGALTEVRSPDERDHYTYGLMGAEVMTAPVFSRAVFMNYSLDPNDPARALTLKLPSGKTLATLVGSEKTGDAALLRSFPPGSTRQDPNTAALMSVVHAVLVDHLPRFLEVVDGNEAALKDLNNARMPGADADLSLEIATTGIQCQGPGPSLVCELRVRIVAQIVLVEKPATESDPRSRI
jgi:hypothetical protein